jgi:hypothetical protein
VRPFYPLFLRAYLRCLEDGKPPTSVNLSRELGVSRQNVHQMLGRHPDLLAWINAAVDRENAHLTASVVRRVANLAMAGSPQHAEIFFRHASGAYARQGTIGDPPGGGTVPAGISFTINNLIPRPPTLAEELAAAGRVVEALPAHVTPAPPVLEVR